MLIKLLRFCSVISCFTWPLLSWGQAHVDLYYGLQQPDAEQTSLRSGYQVTFGYRFDFDVSIGANYMFSSKDEDQGTFEYNLKGIELSYYLNRWFNGYYIATRAGLSDVITDIGGVRFKPNPFIWGWFVGKDFQWVDIFTLGLEGGFYSVNGDEGLVGGVTRTLDKFVAYSFKASIKLWF